MKLIATAVLALAFLSGCSSAPPKPQIPALTPQTAAELLHYNGKAQTWLTHVHLQSPACIYDLDFPDQTNHPAQLDFDHIVKCAGAPAPLEMNASVSFEFDKDTQRWVIKRFSS
jgi:hypothetical protein